MNTAVIRSIRRQGYAYLSSMQSRQTHLLFVLIPMLIIASYRLFIESDRYASETQIVVMSNDASPQDKLGLGLLAGSGVGHQDAKLVKEFVTSLDMLKYLQDTIRILDHYRSSNIDILSRLSSQLTIDEALEYYQDMLHVKFDETSGVIKIEAEGFTPDFSALIARTIVERSESFINQIDNGLAQKRLEFVEKELKESNQKMHDAKQKLVAFSAQHGLVEPEEQSKSLVAVVNELNAELTRDEAQLKNLLSFMNPSAPDVVALKAKIGAIRQQIRGEHGSFAKSGDHSLATLRAQHHDLILSLNFAQDAYKATLVAWERARVESFQKSKYLVKVTQPGQPQYAKYPRRLRNLLSAIFIILVIYGLGVLVHEISREHRA